MAVLQIKKRPVAFGLVFATILLLVSAVFRQSQSVEEKARFWEFQSIDTMKYSRDLAREKISDPTFDVVIEQQIKQIADTGATHVAIATPYDQEFVPFLKRWVAYARQYGLKVWFRGNLAGWERWFEYEPITRDRHIELTVSFITNNPDLFEDGDKFSSCPECENGGPGDPRLNGDATGHKEFLIREYQRTVEAFKKTGKKVDSRYHSMNGDVANLIMDPQTTEKLGGLVVVDHYVRDPKKLSDDITAYAQKSGGKVVLGEFGAPIPDIHGDLSEVEQKEWLEETMEYLSQNEDLVGLNYWTNTGGSTQLWQQNGYKRAAVESLSAAYNPYVLSGRVTTVSKKGIGNAAVKVGDKTYTVNNDGSFTIPLLVESKNAVIEAEGYKSVSINLSGNLGSIVLSSEKPGIIERILYFFSQIKVFSLT